MSTPAEIGPLELEGHHKIVLLTGAGVSVASGLGTYRGRGGLWEQDGAAALASARALQERPLEVWRFFSALRRQSFAAEPNPAHRAIAALQRRHQDDKQVVVITQNVDRLHQRAGSTGVVELHGDIMRTRCVDAACALEPFFDPTPHLQELPVCPRCGAPLRPDVVLFDEPIPVRAERAAKQALRDCQLFLAVGTSGTVTPASNFVRSAQYEGARTIMVNLEPMQPPNPYFEQELLGPAEEVLPRLLASAG
jgi:NAD-dependent deacetylase